MDRRTIICTYHKGGTVWMNRTFRLICTELNIPFLSVKDPPERLVASKPPAVISSSHSNFRDCQFLLEDPECRLFHLIRDPRDVIISGMHYHRVSKEGWLHVPQDKFDGATYQERLNSLQTERDRYLFEIANAYAPIAMGAWDYGRPNCFECKYEDLIVDRDMTLFTRVVTHLGFTDSEIDVCRKAFWTSSLFGGAQKTGGVHVRSGAPQQWRDVFDRALGRAFVRRFGTLLVTLGYEADNSWVRRLPDRSEREALDSPAA